MKNELWQYIGESLNFREKIIEAKTIFLIIQFITRKDNIENEETPEKIYVKLSQWLYGSGSWAHFKIWSKGEQQSGWTHFPVHSS